MLTSVLVALCDHILSSNSLCKKAQIRGKHCANNTEQYINLNIHIKYITNTKNTTT